MIQDAVWAYSEQDLNVSKLMSNLVGLKTYAEGSHQLGQKEHRVYLYKYNLTPDIILYWGYCQDCKVIRSKKIIGYENEYKNGNNGTAYVREFIKHGEAV